MQIAELAKTLILNRWSAEQAEIELRRQMVIAALDRSSGNQCRAAKTLKVHRNTLGRWMDELQLNPRDFRVRRLHRVTA